jgi:dihydrofolate reductase
MRNVIYSMGLSLDGYIADAGGEIATAKPSPELHRFHNDQAREVGVHVCGRRLYEVMAVWDTLDDDQALPDHIREFAEIWKATPKLVLSRTLDGVGDNARLAEGDLAEELGRLKSEPGKDIAIGGATLAASAIELGLVDEVRLFWSPILVGGGTPFFPPVPERLSLELLETRTFESGDIYARYRRNET